MSDKKIVQRLKIITCEHCPFVSGMGGGDEMPGFVRCTLTKQLIDGTPHQGYGKPPPGNCPLRSGVKLIEVSI